jgi:hypothetical protein
LRFIALDMIYTKLRESSASDPIPTKVALIQRLSVWIVRLIFSCMDTQSLEQLEDQNVTPKVPNVFNIRCNMELCSWVESPKWSLARRNNPLILRPQLPPSRVKLFWSQLSRGNFPLEEFRGVGERQDGDLRRRKDDFNALIDYKKVYQGKCFRIEEVNIRNGRIRLWTSTLLLSIITINSHIHV